jgi:hypothetical protein
MIYHAYETGTCKRQQLLVFHDANDEAFTTEALNCLQNPPLDCKQKQSIRGDIKRKMNSAQQTKKLKNE